MPDVLTPPCLCGVVSSSAGHAVVTWQRLGTEHDLWTMNDT